MGDKVGENPAALRAAVFLAISEKPQGGVQTPPAGRRLTRALLGRGRLNAPLRFFADSENTAARSAAGFSPTLPPCFFPNFCENFDPKSCKVRSPGQVKWRNYKITFQSRHGYNVSGKDMKLSEYDEVHTIPSVPTKRISWIFYIGDLRSGHFCEFPIISQWAKNQLCYTSYTITLSTRIFTLAQAYLSVIISYRTVVDNSS